jgi:predicted RNA-binding protein with PIN domain
MFGKACTEMFGQRQRLSAATMARTQTAADVGEPSEADAAIEQRIAALSQAREPQTASVTSDRSRPWGYDVPEGDTWQEKIDARLGIKS